MIHHRKTLELHDEGISLRGIAASTGNFRQKVTEIIHLAERKGLVCPMVEEMTNLTELLPALSMPMMQWGDAIENGSTPTITKEDVINLTLINQVAFMSNDEGRRCELKKIQ